MNEIKRAFIFCSCGFFLMLQSCASTDLHDYGSTAAGTRDAIEQLQDQQTEAAAAGERITAGSAELADSLTAGTTDDQRFEEILREIRKTSAADSGETSEGPAQN